MSKTHVKIVNAAISEVDGDIVLRGDLAPESVVNGSLMIAPYQREQLSQSKIDDIKKGLRSHGVPDIDLGMRGYALAEEGNGVFILKDPVFIIDGQQRTAAQYQLIQATAGLENPIIPRLGAKVHFDTTEESERMMFNEMNLGQTQVSPNVILANSIHESAVLERLYKLTDNRGFIMYGRVCWLQNMKRGQLISAMTYVKVAAMLHSFAGPGKASKVEELINGLDKIAKNVAGGTLVGNVRTFFEVLDHAFGVNNIAYKHGASFMKMTFLLQLAKVFSDHENLWEGEKGDRLQVDRTTIEKLSKFPISDPHVLGLTSGTGSGVAGAMLYSLIIDKLNEGRRSRRLKPRRGLEDPIELEDDGDDGADLAA